MPHRSPYIRHILTAIALLGLIGMAIFSYYIYQTLLAPNTAFEEPQAFVHIKSDDTYKEVYQQLDSLLKDPEKFDAAARKKDYISHVKPGRYKLEKGMNNNAIIIALQRHNLPLPVVFNNQNRLAQLAQRISKQIEADSNTLLRAMRDTLFLAKNDFTRATALNMYIPNQYELYWNTSATQFRERMLKEYKRFWNEERLDKANSINLSPNQVQTLASIVQKETSQVDERKRVAGVYMNRYNKEMKLDADPTVIYALKHSGNKFDTTTIKRVLYKDLKIKSPYNTYLHKGLPPGPIAMPDISSIDAVLNYEDHDFLYFVADPENPGYHNFSRNLSQHNQKKRAYVKWLRKLDIKR